MLEVFPGFTIITDWIFYTFLFTLLLTIIAQIFTKSRYWKFRKIESISTRSADQIARDILKKNKITGIKIMPIGGKRTDYFDRRENSLRLSSEVYKSNSIASIAIASHEAGHAILCTQNDTLSDIRDTFIPIMEVASSSAIPLILIAFLFQIDPLVRFGMIVFIVVVLFHLLTLPIEWKAKNKVMKILNNAQYINNTDARSVEKMLNAISLLYIAAAFTSIFHLLKMIYLSHQD